MQSLHVHVLPSPPANPPSRIYKSKINPPFRQYSPPENIFSVALDSLRTCAENEDPKTASSFHARILKSGIQSDVFIANSLLNVYSKCDQIEDARKVFDEMPLRTVVSWTAMISAYNRNGLLDLAVLLFSMMLEHLQPNEFTLSVILQAGASRGDEHLVEGVHSYAIRSGLISDCFLQNSLLDAYAKSGMLAASEKLLLRLSDRDVVSWTSVVSGCIKAGSAERGLALFCRMMEDDVVPNEVAMITVLQVFSVIKNYRIMEWIHGLVLKGNWCKSGLVLNSLMEMYSTNGYFAEAISVFSSFCFGNEGLYASPETMASLLHGCGSRGSLKLGRTIHAYLIKHGFLPSIVAENSLVNMYAENGCVHSALLVFRLMAKRDVISWNTVMKCFIKNDNPLASLRLLSELHESTVSPDFVTLLTSLEACSELARVLEGRVIHGYATKTGIIGDVFVQNALIDMYAKSGRADLAEEVFDEMVAKDISSWNSIIAAYGVNGYGSSAIEAFNKLERNGTNKPNAVTFINVLSACAHSGLVREGLSIFRSMETDYGVIPITEHYACVVDMLGRAGMVGEAEAFIDKMKSPPGRDVWGALLSACVVVGDVALAEKAAEEFAALEPSSSVWRVALANAYAGVGRWERVGEMRREMRGGRKVRKEGGWSSVDVGGEEFRFRVGDTKHVESLRIYELIGWLQNHMGEEAKA